MEKIRELLTQAIKDTFGVDVRPRVEPSEHADFASNVAMQLAGQVGENPRAIGEKLAQALGGKGFEVEVAGPGFLNFRFADSGLVDELEESLRPGYYGQTQYAGKTVVTEFSDPNPFKVLHVGHLYTSIVGDAISNLIEYAGGGVHRVNFGGDVGMHVAKTMWAIGKRLGGFEVGKLTEVPEAERSEWMAACYVEGTAAYEDDAAAREEMVALNKKIYALHTTGDHESDLARVYWMCRGWSYDYFDAFYAQVGVGFEKYYPESTVAELGLATVREHVGEVYEESEGAVVFRGEPYGLHTRVFINREGIPTYEAKDVGLIFRKWEDYKFDLSVVITGADITEYMKVVLKSIEQYNPKLVERTRHLVHGNVKLAGGVKMSSRKGNFLKAVEVLEMVAKVQAELGEANEAVVLGAAKYALLKSKVEPGDIVFDVKDSVSLQGNSGPYLQYSLARAKSILRKVGEVADSDAGALDEWERTLALKLLGWKEVAARAIEELAPHRVCTYLYELAQEFSRFYERDQVVGGENAALRKKLVQAYVGVMEAGLKILGVPSVERV